MTVQAGAGLTRVIAIVDSYPVEVAVMSLLLMALVVAWWALFRAARTSQLENAMASVWMLLLSWSMFGFTMMLLALCYAMGFGVALSAFVAVMMSLVLMSPVPVLLWRRYRRRGDDARAKA